MEKSCKGKIIDSLLYQIGIKSLPIWVIFAKIDIGL